MRFRELLPALAAVALCAGTAAHAGSMVRSADPAGNERLPGLMSADPNTSEASLVAAARRLPAAQFALQRLADDGYVRAPEADLARTSSGRACISLAFVDPSHPGRAPLVLVLSDPTSTPARLTVIGAVFDVDAVTRKVELAPDIPDGNECMVTVTTPGSTRPDGYTVTSRSVRTAFKEWLECAVLGCGAGGGVCAVGGMLVGPLAPPAIAGCIIAVCATASFFCL